MEVFIGVHRIVTACTEIELKITNQTPTISTFLSDRVTFTATELRC